VHKVTTYPNLTGTVPNFDSLSHENYEAWYHGMGNCPEFRTLSQFCSGLNVMQKHMLTKCILISLITLTNNNNFNKFKRIIIKCTMPNLSSDAFFLLSSKCSKYIFGRGSTPHTAVGAYDASPDPPNRLGRVMPLSVTFPFDAFSVSISAPQTVS